MKKIRHLLVLARHFDKYGHIPRITAVLTKVPEDKIVFEKDIWLDPHSRSYEAKLARFLLKMKVKGRKYKKCVTHKIDVDVEEGKCPCGDCSGWAYPVVSFKNYLSMRAK